MQPSNNLQILINAPSYLDYLIWNLSHLDVQIIKLRNSTYNPLIFPSFEQLLDDPSVLNLASKLKPMPNWPLSLREFGEKQDQLNKACLINSNQQFLDISINTKQWIKLDIMLAIEYLKTFEFFKLLKYSDRDILSKHVAMIIQTMTVSFTSFQTNSDCFKTPDGWFINIQDSMDFFDSITDGKISKNSSCTQSFLKSSQNVMGFLIREKLTSTEYILLKAIAICDPIIELSEEGRKIVWKTRRNYSKTLFKYCETEYGKRNGPSRFATLLSYINLAIYHQKNLRNFMSFLRMHLIYKFPKTLTSLEDSAIHNES